MPAIFTTMPRTHRVFLWKMIYSMCLHGQCYPFAIALHRALGWPMIGLSYRERIVHAVLRRPDGIYFDVRGSITETQLGAPFCIYPPFTLVEVDEETLRRLQPNINDRFILSLQEKARQIWPRLPWTPSPTQVQVEGFLTELEALSRKYGIWIRANTPATPPFLETPIGKEVGYEASVDGTGLKYYFHRALGPAPAFIEEDLSDLQEEELHLDDD
jgi:hypothetical protein